MVRSWSAGSSGSSRARSRLGRRRFRLRMGSLGQSRRTQKQKRQDELVQLGQSGIPARLLTQEAALLALEQALVACLEPRLFPLIITNGCA